MHLAEGVITSPVVWGGGYVIACAGVGIGLRKLDETQAMRTAVMASSFFVASLVHIPLFGVPIHLSLTGLLGVVLGWAAFPAVFVALILQAVLFGFGGVTTLGIGMNNVLDQDPPVIYSGFAGDSDSSSYDYMGRFVYARMSQQF